MNVKRPVSVSTSDPVRNALLLIDEYVPPSLNQENVQRVIWALVMPRHRTPIFGGSYISLDKFRKHFKDISPEEVEDILAWLKTVGVLIERSRKKAGKTLVSLAIHESTVGLPGRKIVRIIKAAAYQRTRMG